MDINLVLPQKYLEGHFKEDPKFPRKVEILQQGKSGGNGRPTGLSTCMINVTPMSEEQGLDLSAFNDSAVRIGDVDCDFGDQLSFFLTTMLPGEKATFLFNLEHHDKLFTIELKSFVPMKQNWTNQELYELSVENKDKGDEIMDRSLSYARRRYSKAKEILGLVNRNKQGRKNYLPKNPTLKRAKILELQTALNLKISTCLLKERKYFDCITVSGWVLSDDPHNETALDNLAECHLHLIAVDICRAVIESTIIYEIRERRFSI